MEKEKPFRFSWAILVFHQNFKILSLLLCHRYAPFCSDTIFANNRSLGSHNVWWPTAHKHDFPACPPPPRVVSAPGPPNRRLSRGRVSPQVITCVKSSTTVKEGAQRKSSAWACSLQKGGPVSETSPGVIYSFQRWVGAQTPLPHNHSHRMPFPYPEHQHLEIPNSFHGKKCQFT